MTPRPVNVEKPANSISIKDGVATLELLPFSEELTEAGKASILSANRQRILTYACYDTPMPKAISRSVRFSDYPPDTFRWCVGRASFINVGMVDCRKDDAAIKRDVEELLARFAKEDDDTDRRFTMTIITDAPYDLADYLQRHRPNVPFNLISVPAEDRALAAHQASLKEDPPAAA
jgi:hypothetical protein